ncbi:DUF2807 domain-containing protein [Novosphingobium mangrovi (ex Huang et al. 2023)]|uniref:DUF2807 domain-containing protein n=1 Tax=Novosphingobium mangrovi (ex Huang et al. 2023) TaxID=2976432 RepID=A0ABT2I8Z0_9SPHN|nr:DUF2807 domain-containing protein [Novosphingobium mangrovi (ex Huang et al. 2023)]MCT2401276.1 DUF2807 domain-containing protein [Novosphingobium mangrovi (ex Huang et al. 2023)]
MFRKLLIVFASGVILSIVAFSAAWLVGGDTLKKEFTEGHGWSWTIGDDEDQGPRKTRTFAVASGTRLAMEVPVELSFTRGDKAEMVVTGPTKIVDRLVWKDGRLSVPGRVNMHHGLKVRITAPEITGLDLDAPGDVTLTGLQQDQFTLKSEGAVSLDADGKVRKVFITSEGAGDIDLERLAVEDATVRMDGVGDVTIGATGLVDIEINGAGHVTLVRKPETLRSRINGVGSVDHDY